MDKKTLESCVVAESEKDHMIGLRLPRKLIRKLHDKYGKDFKLQATVRNLLERLAE